MSKEHAFPVEKDPHGRGKTIAVLLIIAVMATWMGFVYMDQQAKGTERRTDAACVRLGESALADSPKQIRANRSRVAEVTVDMEDRCPDTVRAARMATSDRALRESIEDRARQKRAEERQAQQRQRATVGAAAQSQVEAKEACRRIGHLLAEDHTAGTLLSAAPENINDASVTAECPDDQSQYVRRMNEPETTEVTLRGNNVDGGRLFVTVLLTPADGGVRDIIHSQTEADGWEGTLDVESGEEVTLMVEAKGFGDVVECEAGINDGGGQLDLRDYNTGGIDTFAAECHFQLFTD